MTDEVNNFPRGSRRMAGFTLIELLTVILIIGLLVAILTPSVIQIQRESGRAASQVTINMIDAACVMHFNDFDRYPSSTPKLDVDGTDWYGRHLLVQAIVGYCPDLGGDSEPSSDTSDGKFDDGRAGFGFRMVRRGKVYGPYNGTERIKTKITPGDNTGDPDKPTVFIDAFDNEVYYYRFDDTRPANQKYDRNDNTGGPFDAGVDPNNDNDYARPMLPDPPPDNNYYRRDFILMSKGPDRYWNNDTDAKKQNDIKNF